MVDLGDVIYLEILREGIMVGYLSRVCREDDVTKLDTVLREGVHEVEVEIA